MKILMRVMLSSLPASLGFGCSGQTENQKPRIERIYVSDLKMPEIQHEQLSDDQLRRIKKLQETFAEVDKSSLEPVQKLMFQAFEHQDGH